MKSAAGDLRLKQAVVENFGAVLDFDIMDMCADAHLGRVCLEIAAVGDCESLKKAD